MALVVFPVFERVRLATGAVSIFLCTIGGARSMSGKWDCMRHAMGSSGLMVGVGSVGLSSGFEMTTLGCGAGGLSLRGRRIGCRMEHGLA